MAASSPAIAKQALELIEVDYEVLPHVTDVDAAMQGDAPVLHEDMFTAGMEPRPDKASNVAGYYEVLQGDVEAGFGQADIVVEREFTTEATHQGYIEPHAVLATIGADGRGEIWVCTQGHFDVRNMCSRMCGIDIANLRVTASEIGGGFGGKTTVFLEPVACALSRKSGHPVKMVMSREEVFRASGPTSSSRMRVKIGMTKEGRITAGEAGAEVPGGGPLPARRWVERR